MSAVALADRLREVEGSPTLALAAKAKALVAEGNPVLNFTAGEPDFPTPTHVKQAGIRAIRANQTRYTPAAGIPELRSAIASAINAQRQTAYDAAQVIVTCGAKHALFNVFQALCQPGDEVLVFSPYWVSFPPLVRLSGATPIIVPTAEEDGFQPDPDAVRAAITDATKAIIINSPSNPTGAVISTDRLKAIGQLAADRGLIVVSDEMYDRLVFPPARHLSIVQAVPHLAEQTVVIGGVSKTYSMTGWRIGYAAGPRPWISAMINAQSHSTSNPTSISQHAALAALTGSQQSVEKMLKEFDRRRRRFVTGLNRLAPLRCTEPAGTFYLWCNISGLGHPAEAIAARWLEEAHIAVVPGEGFGAPNFVRFSFATSVKTIDAALVRLADWLRTRRR